jgi:hypothetical protein
LTDADKTRANMLNANTAKVRIESQSSSRCRRLKHPLQEEESCALANQKKRLAGAFLGPPLEVVTTERRRFCDAWIEDRQSSRVAGPGKKSRPPVNPASAQLRRVVADAGHDVPAHPTFAQTARDLAVIWNGRAAISRRLGSRTRG